MSFLDTLFGQSGASANLAPLPGGPPDYAALNPDAGNTAALEKLLAPDPYAEFDKKRKEEAEKQAAMGVFGSGAAPVPAAGISGLMAQGAGGQGTPFSLAPQRPGVPPSLAVAQAMTAPPPQAPQPPQGAPMPPPGAAPPPAPPPTAPPQTNDEDTPPNAAPTQGRGPAPMGIAGPPAPTPEPSFMDKLSSGMKSISPALLGVGAALQGDMGATTRSMLKEQQALAEQTQTQNLTAKALLAKGVDPTTVAAAVRQPEMLKALVADQFGKSKYKVQKTGQDEFGNEQYSVINENDATDVRPFVNGKLGPKAGEGTDTSPTSSGGYLQPGVKAVDRTLTGDDYLKQYSPEVQAAVKNYLSGETMPTANPRKGWVQNIKSIAQKYAGDIGVPADDATFGARRTMRNDLAKSSPGSIGGQIGIGNTALGHLADMAKQATGLGNVDVGLAGPSHVLNDIRGMTSAQAAKMEALKGAAQHYGQEVTKFYSGSPGGEAERNRFLATVDGAKTPQELAAVIETEAALMKDRIKSLESNIRTTLGDEATKKFPVVRPEGHAAIEQIDANVSKLRGGNAPAQIASKAQYDALPAGSAYIAPDGSHRVKK